MAPLPDLERSHSNANFDNAPRDFANPIGSIDAFGVDFITDGNDLDSPDDDVLLGDQETTITTS